MPSLPSVNRWSASCKPLDRTAGRLVLTEGNQGNEAPWPKVIPLELGRTRLRPAVSRGLGTDSTQLGLTFESGRAPALQGRATRRHRHACSRSWIALSGRRGRWAMGFRGRCPRLRWDQAFGLSYTNADGRTSPGQASFISHSRSLAFIRGLPHSESPPSLSASIAFPGGGGWAPRTDAGLGSRHREKCVSPYVSNHLGDSEIRRSPDTVGRRFSLPSGA